MATKAEYVILIKGSAAQFDRTMKGIKRHVNDTRIAFRKLAPTIRRAGLALGAITATGVGWALKLAGEAEALATSFEIMTGSAATARDVMAELDEFSRVTPFTPRQIREAGRTLLAFGVTAEEVRDRLEQIGNAAAVSGSDLNELALTYGKALQRPTVLLETLNQINERGVTINEELAKNLGVSADNINAMATASQITRDEFIRAFRTMSQQGGRYFGALERQSETFNGQLSTLTGNIEQAAERFGTQLLPVLKELTPILIELAEELTKMASDPAIRTFLEDSVEFMRAAIPFMREAARFNLILPSFSNIARQLGIVIRGLRGDTEAGLEEAAILFRGVSDAADQYLERLEKARNALKETSKTAKEATAAVREQVNEIAQVSRVGLLGPLLTPANVNRAFGFLRGKFSELADFMADRVETNFRQLSLAPELAPAAVLGTTGYASAVRRSPQLTAFASIEKINKRQLREQERTADSAERIEQAVGKLFRTVGVLDIGIL